MTYQENKNRKVYNIDLDHTLTADAWIAGGEEGREIWQEYEKTGCSGK